MRGRYRIALLIREGIRAHDPLRLDDFAIDARTPVVLAFGRSHTKDILAAHPKVYFAGGRSELFRPPPAHQMLGVSPGLPHQFARRVEDSSNDNIAPGGFVE